MNNPISFSVIIPLYNKGMFIQRAIQSVLDQTEQNFEIIVVNDGSTDNSLEVIKQIDSPKLKIINQENAGVSAARNKGAKNANNVYLAFLDGDDTWDNDFLKKVKELIIRFPNAGIYGTNNYFLYPNGDLQKNELDDLFDGQKEGLLKDYFKTFADLQRSPFSNSNLCIPKRVYDELGGYKVGVKLTEDSDLWCRIAFKYSIAYTTEPLATYFLAQEGSTHSIFENKPFEVVNTLQQALVNNEIDSDKIDSVKKLIALQKIGLIKRGILTKNKSKIYGNFLDSSIISYYPKEYIKCFVATIIPSKLFNRIKSKQ
ncbi:glycosyltransferase family A protein [Empedobacter sp.]|uniref:glycosyltransferase family 2 protein n=1 Tax=Empedobacter sp. TaxID=1927715 RepID=UPI0028ACADC3|nr:glycosyltransferase family A protein [Empedobacter sp.]